MSKQNIKTEIRIALSHPTTDAYIKVKANHIIRMMKNQNYSDEVKKEINNIELRLSNIPEPFDWNKNIKSYDDLSEIIKIIHELEEISETN